MALSSRLRLLAAPARLPPAPPSPSPSSSSARDGRGGGGRALRNRPPAALAGPRCGAGWAACTVGRHAAQRRPQQDAQADPARPRRMPRPRSAACQQGSATHTQSRRTRDQRARTSLATLLLLLRGVALHQLHERAARAVAVVAARAALAALLLDVVDRDAARASACVRQGGGAGRGGGRLTRQLARAVGLGRTDVVRPFIRKPPRLHFAEPVKQARRARRTRARELELEAQPHTVAADMAPPTPRMCRAGPDRRAPERTSLIWNPPPAGMPSASSRLSGRLAPLMTMGPLRGERGRGRGRRAAVGARGGGC